MVAIIARIFGKWMFVCSLKISEDPSVKHPFKSGLHTRVKVHKAALTFLE